TASEIWLHRRRVAGDSGCLAPGRKDVADGTDWLGGGAALLGGDWSGSGDAGTEGVARRAFRRTICRLAYRRGRLPAGRGTRRIHQLSVGWLLAHRPLPD